ncbi:MAG: hypothetical protein ACM34N_17915, partial [Ignavibacteria bacterium]
LQEVYQPLYVSVEVRQERYLPGTKLHLALFVINDLHKSFFNCLLEFLLNKKILGKIKINKIEEDSIKLFTTDRINIFLPKKIEEGKHKIDLQLKTGKKIISKNSFEIEVIDGKKLL